MIIQAPILNTLSSLTFWACVWQVLALSFMRAPEPCILALLQADSGRASVLGFRVSGCWGSWSEIICSTCNRIQYHRNHSHGRVMVILTRETSGSVDLQLASFFWLVGSRTSDSTFDGALFAWVTTFSQAGGGGGRILRDNLAAVGRRRLRKPLRTD